MDPETIAFVKIWGPYAFILTSVTGYFVKKERDFHRERAKYTQELKDIIKKNTTVLEKVNESVTKLTKYTDNLSEERDFHKERLEYTQALMDIIKETSAILGKVNESVNKLTTHTDSLSEAVSDLVVLRRFLQQVAGVEPGKTARFYLDPK